MAKSCGSCGAGFSGDGAAEALATHVEDFHPPRPADAPAPARAPRGPGGADTEARAAIATLGERSNRDGERLTDLEARVTALEAAADETPVDATRASDPAADAGADTKTPAKLGAKASG